MITTDTALGAEASAIGTARATTRSVPIQQGAACHILTNDYGLTVYPIRVPGPYLRAVQRHLAPRWATGPEVAQTPPQEEEGGRQRWYPQSHLVWVVICTVTMTYPLI